MSISPLVEIQHEMARAVGAAADTWQAEPNDGARTLGAEELIGAALQLREGLRRIWEGVLDRARADQLREFEEAGQMLRGLAESTLVVLTSDHGEMGGDHWLLEKLGFWDESYHVPLIVVDPRREADGARGTIVESVTESVDVLPTICDFMGTEVPRQADGWSLDPFLRGDPVPAHWRDTAHFEWSFSDPVNQLAERAFGIPMSHCALAVSRGPRYKYVQFAADATLLPPLLFDLSDDPEQTHDLLAEQGAGAGEAAWVATRELLQWQMRTAEHTLSGSFLDPERGLVEARDTWR